MFTDQMARLAIMKVREVTSVPTSTATETGGRTARNALLTHAHRGGISPRTQSLEFM